MFAQNKKNLFLRSISGMVVMFGILGSLWQGGWLWSLVAALLALLSLGEYYRLLSSQFHLSRGVGYLSAIAVLLSTTEGLRPISITIILSLTLYIVFMVEMARRQAKGTSMAVQNSGGILSGILFIVVPWTCLILLRGLPTGRLVLVALFACTWSCDVVAYIVGSLWGSAPLCDSVSPNKTWQGFIGGALGSILTISAIIYFQEQPLFPLFLIGVICAFAGQLGDLAESLVKRETNAKDSGKIIPGHGGIFDRFDSILLNGLLTYLVFGVVLS
ncbi:phosphatidate cytidylyltransferase [Synergistales bacterium]|nr:phosphatidate cytidylyltransferase [Synergistales bacterium]